MAFLGILHMFRDFALDVLPLFIIALAISAVSAQCFPPRSLDELIQRNGARAVLVSAFFGVLLPVTSGYRIPMAAIARKGGAPWMLVLTFIGTGAAASISTIIVTSLIGWQFAVLRLIVALLFAFILSLIFRVLEPRLAPVAIGEVESLFNKDYCEASGSDSDVNGTEDGLIGIWQGFLRLGKVVLPWLLLSMILAILIQAMVPGKVIESFFSGPLSAPSAALIGFPFYFVIGTDVPLLLVLLKKGMSLGGVIAFMLAAPVVNFPVLSMVSRWLGYRVALVFITVCWLVASAIGALFGYVGAK
ncbi:MAG: permease [Actinobacteria bacterium]|nr:permease [Actinomycetota bacterium]